MSTANGETMASWRQRGVSPLEFWHTGNIILPNFGTIALTANAMFFIPYPSLKGGTLDRIQFETTNTPTATAKVRVGIYKGITDLGLWVPGGLLADFGEQTINAGPGLWPLTINQALADNTLYYLAIAANSVATQPIVRASQVGFTDGFFGTTTLSSVIAAWRVAFTYAAFPTQPPGGTYTQIGGTPLVAVRYSS